MNRYILKIIVVLNLAVNIFAAIAPASHEEVVLFKDDQGIDAEIRRHVSSCGGFHALALFKVAADVLSGNNLQAETTIKKYFKKSNIIEDLTRIVQAVRLGRGYRDGLRTDMNVPSYIMEGYRANLNFIGNFISKHSEEAARTNIFTTQTGADFTTHLKLTNQLLHRSENKDHPKFVFSSAVVAYVQPVQNVLLIPASEPTTQTVSHKTSFLVATDPEAKELPVQLQIRPAEKFAAMEIELINKRADTSKEYTICVETADENWKIVRGIEAKLEGQRKKISAINQKLEHEKRCLNSEREKGKPNPLLIKTIIEQIEKTTKELKAETEKHKDEEKKLIDARRKHYLANAQQIAAIKALRVIDTQLCDLRAAIEQNNLTQIRKRVAELNLGDMPLNKARKALEFIDECRASRVKTYDVIPDSTRMIEKASQLLEKYNHNFFALQNIHEILSALFSEPLLEEISITDGIERLNSLPKKLLKVRGLGEFFKHIRTQLKLDNSHLLYLISYLSKIPAEFAERIIGEHSTKLFAWDTRGMDYRIGTAMHSIVTGILETTKEEEFQEFFSTLNEWNMKAQSDELLSLLRGDLYASVRCEDALRWLNQCPRERRQNFVEYFIEEAKKERPTLKSLTGANSSFLHLLAGTFYKHESVQFTKEMVLAMRSMDFSTYPSESQFVAFRDVYLQLVGRAYSHQYLISEGPQLLKQLYAASNEFSNFEAMLRLLNRYEDLVLADSEATDPKVYKPCASLLVPGLLVKSRAMVLDSFCRIGERNAELITFANDVLCQDFFDAEDLVNCGEIGSETLPYISCCNSPLGYGRASCNTWNRAQVMEVVARNVENMKNPNRQRALECFIQDGAIGEQRAWIVSAFCEVPDSVIDSPDFQSLCQQVAERGDRPKMMQYYTTYYNKKGGLGLCPSVCLSWLDCDLADSQKAVVLRDLIDMADSADPSYRMGPREERADQSNEGAPLEMGYWRSLSDDPRFNQDSDDKKIQLYAYLFHAAGYKYEASPVNKHTVSGKTSLIRPASRIAPTPLIIVRDENDESVYAEAPLDFGGHEIVDEYGNITYIPDPMYKTRVDAHNVWIERGRAQPIAVQ